MAKVLVIDDEHNFRTILEMVLRSHGYEVLLADSGTTGLSIYQREHPAVVVLDLKMPGMDGIAVFQEMRRENPKQPVIVLSGDSSPETEREVRALGVSEFIVKGRSVHVLTDTLKRLLASLSHAA
ncbi:MAG TPA: response regulator [Nitrospiraceae bacterium]|nr:response regulator [Nitrospiraceae bacterium]